MTKKGLHITHLNIHYLYPKLDEIKILLHTQTNIDILCLCETFLHEEFSDNELRINNYNLIRKDRQSHGGGLLIYSKSELPCIQRDDLEINDLELIWLEVRNHKQKSFLICYCYRPPSSTSEWVEKFEQSLEKANVENKEIILLGDFNFNLLNETSNTRSWLRTINSLQFDQLVQEPTRITDTTETLIDHVYSNLPENIIEVSVPCYAISDHYPVCLTRKPSNSLDRGPIHKFIQYRDTKYFSENDFISELATQPWSVIDIFDDPNDALDFFMTIFNSVLDQHAPKKHRRVKRLIQPNWINSEITTAIKMRDRFHQLKNVEQYRIWRNKVKILIQKSKKEFYAETINNNHRNPKQLWQNLHDITNKSSKHQTYFIHDEDGTPILDPEVTANKFNDYFTSVCKTHTSAHKTELPTSTKLNDYVRSKIPAETEFKVLNVTESFIQKQLQTLRTNKAAGIDEISAKYLKISAPVIGKPLASILNLSIQKGFYPESLKVAKVTPIHKAGCKAQVNNYRPISVLPIISSIFERHISNCLGSFLEKNKLIHPNQSGFRKQHSCQTSLTKIIDHWLSAINDNDLVGTVFLDLTKAFDLVNHKFLLHKLSQYQFSASTLKWFDSYLSDRFQQVHVSGKLSDRKEITAGVPQGSVLGPILFILYINDLPLHTDFSVMDFFADDATMSATSSSIYSLTNYLNADLISFQSWCSDNNMVINVNKTKAMFISSRQNVSKIMNNPPVITVSGTQIQISEEEKLLGVHIDNTLSWQSQVEKTIKKCNSLLYLLRRIKGYISIEIRKLFYNAYILPHLDYCCSIWGNTNEDLINNIVKFQKRAARLILDKDFDTPSEELFTELNWMKFPERVVYQKAILMFKTMHDLAPSYLKDIFRYTGEIHNRNLRSTSHNLLYIPKPKCELYRKSMAFSGSKIWNTIPETVKNANSVQQFKQRYLQWKRT